MKKCNFCNQTISELVAIVNIKEDGTVETTYCCKDCLLFFENKSKEKLDLFKTNSVEEIFNFLSEIKCSNSQCDCGTSENDLNKKFRFGCENCYNHFKERMEKIVFPYHKASRHIGKIPKRNKLENPIEIEKLLKLKYAKALELEEYEKCAEIKKDLEDIIRKNSYVFVAGNPCQLG